MIDDPIVNEIRQVRQAYAARFNNNLHAICEDLRRQERGSGREFRTPAPRAEGYRRREATVARTGAEARDPGQQDG
jgi:hypothetical protein